jgi:hypothetical protein
MPRTSPDPVVKIAISMPRSLRERAQARIDQLGAPGFSQYLQYLISMDVHDAPNEIHYHFRTRNGQMTRHTLRVPDKAVRRISRVANKDAPRTTAEDAGRYPVKKKAVKKRSSG